MTACYVTDSLRLVDVVLTTLSDSTNRIPTEARLRAPNSTTRGCSTTKRILTFASIILLFGAAAYARNVFKFTFSEERFSNGAQGTIYASIKIMNNGEANVCDYESTDGQFLGMYQDTNMLFPRYDSVDAGTVENYCLRTSIVEHKSYSQRLWQWTGLAGRCKTDDF